MTQVESLARSARAALRRLGRLMLVPFTMLRAVLFAAVRHQELRGGRAVLRVGRTMGATAALPWHTMLWLARIASECPAASFDACLRLPKNATDANLHDVFSVLMTSRRLSSIGLYWDDAALSDDQPLWQDGGAAPAVTSGTSDIGTSSVEALDRFFHAEHEQLDLPIAARREAQTLLKRLAGGAYTVCLNLPLAQRPPLEALMMGAPDVRFFDLGPLRPAPRGANVTSLATCGLTLHERLAIAQAADAYIGSFDELGGAAIIGGRPGALVGAGPDENDDAHALSILGHGARLVWFPTPAEQTVAAWAAAFLRQRGGTDV
jgi:hypothetical protein